ncbi:malto-oligosyltrehalose synthase [Spirochaeta africana]|uniref:Malto-oligosyltrehalose synthase n=1 Tax=Spirochaeta africana (strain ATCC 700263 / DSM 8902 / Z-7692) TaxID=889378 RepID=H9UFW8_SPIAZ|nr:malto-oligosyltrehalose synthase [Spirochaeta africana]AFG36411.1 malto-oligosyltrehalose synthase [Spirochaeta africana DSM 8902]
MEQLNSHQGPPPYPRATIRLQFRKEFTFADAQELVPYFAQLGASHIYASPVLLARPGSTHGYDIVDHNRFNPEIGTEESFAGLCRALHEHGMGLIMDFVPNHMGVGSDDNEWWLDVLEWGKSSPFAKFFDIDWDPVEAAVKGKILLPVLGDQYGTILENGELVLTYDHHEGSFSLWYYQHRFPIAVRHYGEILRLAGERCDKLLPYAKQFREIGTGGRSLRQHTLKRNEADDLKRRLSALISQDEQAKSAVQHALDRLNGIPGQPRSFDPLHALIQKQAYRPAYWRVAANEINYRRFFDINDLAALRMEQPELFDISHQLIFRLISEGKLQGLRLDHVDGLWDPRQYFERLQDRAAYALFESPFSGVETLGAHPDTACHAPEARLDQPFYVLVEKIMAKHETIRADWAISGTTGYEFLNTVNGLQVNHDAEEPLTDLYRSFTGRSVDLEQMIVEAKHLIMQDSLASELNVIANKLNRLAKQSRRTQDFSRIRLRQAFADISAYFPVYRSYVTERGIDPDGRRDVEWAVAKAKKASKGPDKSVYDFLYNVLTTDLLQQKGQGYRKSLLMEIVMGAQQFTGPVMAKAIEDTVFYRFGRLISMNEVGGHPDHFGSSVSAFHYQAKHRLQTHPFAMITSATHDHKRGEDTRARINMISELHQEWAEAVLRWSTMNARKKRITDDGPTPSPGDEYFLYQTLVGTFPVNLDLEDPECMDGYIARIRQYMEKSIREAKIFTSWTNVNQDYEDGMNDFIEKILTPNQSSVFLNDLQRFVRRILPGSYVNGLMQTTLKLTSPGVPDIYQGNDMWDYSLVDPDNRRPVDYGRRIDAMQRDNLSIEHARWLLETAVSGEVKLHVIRCILGLRRCYPDIFATGDYLPLETTGEHADRVLAFSRVHQDTQIVVIVPVQTAGLIQDSHLPLPVGWGDTVVHLTDQDTDHPWYWNNCLTGADLQGTSLMVSEVLADFPVAVLVKT